MANALAISNKAIDFLNGFVDGEVCESEQHLIEDMKKCLNNMLNSEDGRKFSASAWKWIKSKARSAADWVTLCYDLAKPYLSDWQTWLAVFLIAVLVGLDYYYFSGVVTATVTAGGAGAAGMLRLAWPYIKEAKEKQKA